MIFDERPLIFVPLYHPSYSHQNKYAGDYDALKAILAGEFSCG